MKLRVTAAAGVVILAWALSGIVQPPPGLAVAGIHQFTDTVTLVQGGAGWIPRFLAARREIPRRGDRAVVEFEIADLHGLYAVSRCGVGLEVEGYGRLPVSAGEIRGRGWSHAWGELVRPGVESALARVDPSEIVEADPEWAGILIVGLLTESGMAKMCSWISGASRSRPKT